MTMCRKRSVNVTKNDLLRRALLIEQFMILLVKISRTIRLQIPYSISRNVGFFHRSDKISAVCLFCSTLSGMSEVFLGLNTNKRYELTLANSCQTSPLSLSGTPSRIRSETSLGLKRKFFKNLFVFVNMLWWSPKDFYNFSDFNYYAFPRVWHLAFCYCRVYLYVFTVAGLSFRETCVNVKIKFMKFQNCNRSGILYRNGKPGTEKNVLKVALFGLRTCLGI